MNYLLAIAVAAVSAAAPNPKEADALFKQARTLIKEGKSAQACPLLERSHALDPALGTLLNLGDCYETTGRLVQAFLSFNEAAAWASRNHEANRAEIARARAGGLKSRLSWVALSTAAAAPGLTVSVNGFIVELGTAAQSVPVDAGKLKIVATAVDRETWTTTVSVAAGQSVAVVVPALALASELKRPDDLKQFEASLSVVPLIPIDGPSERPSLTARVQPASRTAAVGLMSAGAVVAATGIAGIGWSLSSYDRLQKQQPGQPGFGAPTVTRAELATVRWVYPAAWITAGVGVAAAAAGAVLYLKGSQTSFALVPTPSGVGVAASGSF
jgi:hypothetical protein